MIQLKDFVKLVAWKSGQGQGQKLIAATCYRKDFESLLKSFITGVTLRDDDNFYVTLFTSQYCTPLLLLLLLLLLMMMMIYIDDNDYSADRFYRASA